jgi:hypothetical protein
MAEEVVHDRLDARRTSSASASRRTALFPQAMSYPTPEGLTRPSYATTPPMGTA